MKPEWLIILTDRHLCFFRKQSLAGYRHLSDRYELLSLWIKQTPNDPESWLDANTPIALVMQSLTWLSIYVRSQGTQHCMTFCIILSVLNDWIHWLCLVSILASSVWKLFYSFSDVSINYPPTYMSGSLVY